jgi:hypothetical protein
MKKTILLIFVTIIMLSPFAWGAARDNSQTAVYFCSGGTTGGGSFSLDSLDQTGDGDTDITDGTPNQYDLVTNDAAFVLMGVGNIDTYTYNSTATFTELDRIFIRPDDYGSSGVWTNTKAVTYDLSDGEQKRVRYTAWYAAENIFDGARVYIKWVAGNTRPEVFIYTADTTDTDNDTYPSMGETIGDCTSGNPCVIDLHECTLARRDGFSYVKTDIGKGLFTSGGAGYQGTTQQDEPGDHNEMVGIFLAATGSDAGFGFSSITGDYVLYWVIPYVNVVPTP